MSEEPSSQPEPTPGAAPAPENPIPVSQTEIQTETVQQQLMQSLQAAWQWARPVLILQSLNLLRLTIRGLSFAVTQLENIAPLPPDPAQTPLIITDLREQLGPWCVRLKKLGKFLLQKVRTRLPDDWNQRLSDRALAAAIAALVIVLYWFTSLFFPAPAKTTPVVARPPRIETPETVKVTAPPELKAPTSEAPVSVVPSVSPVPEPAIAPKPKPVELTPEQKLTAKLQTNLSELANEYQEGLVQAVKPDFERDRLRVQLSADWFNLTASQQTQLANEILSQAQKLDLNRLELTDVQGSAIARSPVVGTEMIILKRQAAPA